VLFEQEVIYSSNLNTIMGQQQVHKHISTMKPSFKSGLSFGLTSGVMTTLGLMVGLYSGTHSRAVVVGGILTIAIADAMSDALGIHIAEESKNNGVVAEIWESTIATFVA
jgi:hypothetical protein